MRELTNEKNYNCLNYGYIINSTNSDNVEQIIDEITSEPRPINSDAIQNVKEYISEYPGSIYCPGLARWFERE